MIFILYLFDTLSDPMLVIDMSYGRMLGEGALTTEPIHILDHCIRQLRR
jgi:hypothetical protein